ncbi:PP2C family protein-serine/threonine phosphatase [Candidatus Solirubrobacter pratensis]|uniref:PP2C family protein-serine/threonine phosphatase n=1 Tax=Candidatus Solirubrobacter pratensis TaxID=1298857 RepID=UPI0003F7E1D3|nr:PP2C family protein-serine/threonine phosphatase [Candidatus Solirubrobacter pratensis]
MAADSDLAREPLGVLPARVIERIRALAGGGLAAIYLIDVEGVCLLRFAGDDGLPERLEAIGAVGPEFEAESSRQVRQQLVKTWPECTVAPLWVLGRAVGVLATTEAAGGALSELACAVAPAFELASGFTDVFERGRRRKRPSTAAEIQLELFPARIARLRGGQVVASVLPAYDVGGDWFDHAENPEGVWIATGDAMGKGVRAAAISAVSIGAFRTSRRQGAQPSECCLEMHRAVHDLDSHAFLTAIVGLWRPTRDELAWANCGHLPPLLLRNGTVRELRGETTYPLGILDRERAIPSATIRVRSGDRMLIYSDGIVEARRRDGTRLGSDWLQRLLLQTAGLPASATVAAIERAVLDATDGEVADDATQVLLDVD